MRRAAPLLPIALLLLVAVGAGAAQETAREAGTAAAKVGPASLAPFARQADPLEAALHLAAKIGSRPAAGRGERLAHRYVAERFEAAGLSVSTPGVRVPGRGRSRKVIGERETARECLTILMAHTDSVPPGLGANDNASGVGVLVALAPRLAKLDPPCDVWLVATGAEERVVIGTRYHVGAAALVKTVRRRGPRADLRFALSADMVGRGRRFYLRSPQAGVRPGVEGEILAAARRAGVTVRWAPDSGTGNSDHREFELAGLPGAVLEAWKGTDACHHERCDRPGRLQRGALNRALRVLQQAVSG